MNSDNFEERLQRQPFRKIPEEWRREVLFSAEAKLLSERGSVVGKHDPARNQCLGWRLVLSTLLWPSPAAWGGLAAIWVLILTLGSHDTKQSVAENRPLVPEMIAALKEQEQILKELVEPSAPRVADRPKPSATIPRSERQGNLSIA